MAPQPGGSAKAQRRAHKKELARAKREEELRRAKRARFVRTWVTLVFISGFAVLAITWFLRPDAEEPAPSLPGELATEPPWPANTAQLPERLDALALPETGDIQHDHASLQVFVGGEPVVVPTGIGVAGETLAPIRTTTDDGTLHLVSDTPYDFTVGDAFDVWGVRLTDTCVGGVCASDGEELAVFVNGAAADGSPRDVRLVDGSVVVLTLGTPEQLPDPVPASFDATSVVE
jgi:hypothetical protein